MSKRDLLGMMKGLEGVVKLQTERIRTLEKQVSEILECNSELVEAPKIKTLDQSVFDGHTPDWKWAAVDSDGCACLYHDQPTLKSLGWSANGSYKLVKGSHDTLDWQNSLIERESKREVLEGNERIRRLLEKQKLVIVKVSDGGYEDATQGCNISLCIRYFTRGSFPIQTNDDNYWRYGIPIDNNGNEILDVE